MEPLAKQRNDRARSSRIWERNCGNPHTGLISCLSIWWLCFLQEMMAWGTDVPCIVAASKSLGGETKTWEYWQQRKHENAWGILQAFSMWQECENFLFHVHTQRSSPTLEDCLSNYVGKMAYSVGITMDKAIFPCKSSFSLPAELLPALTFLSSYLRLRLISYTWLLLTKKLVSLQKNARMALYLWVHMTSSNTPLSRSSSPVKQWNDLPMTH